MTFAQRWRDVTSGEARGISASLQRLVFASIEPIYAAVVARKNRGFDSGRVQATDVGVPVMSVGNLTVGGTGKTPMVVWLAKWFRSRGVQVTIISRGYGARDGQPNDEYREIAAQLPEAPHLQNPDRIAAAREALARQPKQVLILDDAFQHRRIARSLDLVLLDALNPFGGGRLLPRGLLREPVASLRRAHAVALSRADAITAEQREGIRQQVHSLAPQAIWLELEHQPASLVDCEGEATAIDAGLRSKRTIALCGIGNPAGFFHTLATCGAQVIAQREYPDHFAYPPDELDRLEAWVRTIDGAEAVVCTHKDLVKIPRRQLAHLPLRALRIEATIRTGKAELETQLERLAAIVRE